MGTILRDMGARRLVCVALGLAVGLGVLSILLWYLQPWAAEGTFDLA